MLLIVKLHVLVQGRIFQALDWNICKEEIAWVDLQYKKVFKHFPRETKQPKMYILEQVMRLRQSDQAAVCGNIFNNAPRVLN